MSAAALHPRFPSASFVSLAEFTAFRQTTQERLDARYAYEMALPTRDDRMVLPGTCALCLRRTRFACDTGAWDKLADGRRLPRWDDSLLCDCADALGKRSRAVVHFAQSIATLRPWTRLLLFGPPDPSHPRLAALAAETHRCAALTDPADGKGLRLDVPDGHCHLAVAVECLHQVPLLDAAFAAFRRALAPGGALVFTVPFHPNAAATVTRSQAARPGGRHPGSLRGGVHDIGWDVLDRLRAAGFAQAAVHCYWSAELGYLGAFSMILHAAA